MALYFLILYCDLRALRAERWRLTIWKAFSLGALIGATLAYETVLPMFLANSLLVWYFMRINRSEAASPHGRRISFMLYSTNVVAVAIIFAFKSAFSSRNETIQLLEHPLRYMATLVYRLIEPIRVESDFGFNLWQFIEVDLIDQRAEASFDCA